MRTSLDDPRSGNSRSRWGLGWIVVLAASLLACTQISEVKHRHVGSHDLAVSKAAFETHKELVRDGVLVRPSLKKLGHSVSPTAHFRFYADGPIDVHVGKLTAAVGDRRVELQVDQVVSLTPDEASSLHAASVTCEFRDAEAQTLFQQDGVTLDLAFKAPESQHITFEVETERTEKWIPAVGGW